MMGQFLVSLLVGLIRVCFLAVSFALLLLFLAFVLVQMRDWIMNVLKTDFLRTPFEKFFEISDRLDERYIEDNIYGNAMWLTPLLWIGVASAVGLLILLITLNAVLE